MNTNTVGSRLKEIRKDAGLTQTEAAHLIGITQQNWQSAEKGKSNMPYEKILKLAEHFEVNVSWLLTGEGSKTGASSNLINTEKGMVVSLLSSETLANLKGQAPGKDAIQNVIFMPGLNSSSACYAMEVSGQNMEPEIKKGSKIIIEEIENQGQFVDGKIYVLVIKKVPFIKRVHMVLSGKDAGKFKVSDENGVGEQVIDLKEIKAWYKVIYVINPV